MQTIAPAKVNLCLHINGQRDDGYHLLDSLAVMASVADRISLQEADLDTPPKLAITGPFAEALQHEDIADNLIVKASNMLRNLVPAGMAAPETHFYLEKHIPVAAGVGGGSSNAAAALRLTAHHLRSHDIAVTDDHLLDCAEKLGADVAVCLHHGLSRKQGIGELISPVAATRN